jgi:THO complex subunit 2
MEKYLEAYKSDVNSRIAGAKTSQLAMAAPLESGSSKPQAPSEQKKPTDNAKAPPSQKASLIMALLSIGALRPAIWILSRFPWMVDAHPEIADLIIRVLNYSLTPLWEPPQVTRDRSIDFSKPRARWGSTGVTYPPSRRAMLTIWAPTPPSTSSVDFVFFFPDWVRYVPMCTQLDDLADVIEPLMRFVGLHISRDPLLVTKYLRLGRQQLSKV